MNPLPHIVLLFLYLNITGQKDLFANGQDHPGMEKGVPTIKDSNFVLKGRITGRKKGIIKLIYSDKNGNHILDSTEIRNGRFRFRGPISEPTKVFLEGPVASHDMNDPNFTSFFVEPHEIRISLVVDNFKNAVVTGSKTQLEQMELNRSTAPVFKEMEPLAKEYQDLARQYRQAVKAKKDVDRLEELQEKMDLLQRDFEPYRARIRQIEYEFFTRFPQSFVTAYQLRVYADELPLDSLQHFYDQLGPTRQSIPGREIARQIERRKLEAPKLPQQN